MNLNTGKYWSKAWQLADGCTPVSAGCDNCWSAAMAYRFQKPLIAGKALDTGRISFSGNIRINDDRLDLPLKTKKPTVWAVWNDLFHEDVPIEFIAEAINIMASCYYTCKKRHEHDEDCETEETGHTYLILTKRPERMLKVLEAIPNYIGEHWDYENALSMTIQYGTWPLDNVYLGTSVENQQTANERVPHLLQIPGKKFLSIEPMLGEIIIPPEQLKELSQVICGGETGHNARTCHPDWVRSIRNQCQEAGVPFFFKGWGEWYADKKRISKFTSSVIGRDTVFHRVGHKAAGRILDGRTHDALIWRQDV